MLTVDCWLLTVYTTRDLVYPLTAYPAAGKFAQHLWSRAAVQLRRHSMDNICTSNSMYNIMIRYSLRGTSWLKKHCLHVGSLQTADAATGFVGVDIIRQRGKATAPGIMSANFTHVWRFPFGDWLRVMIGALPVQLYNISNFDKLPHWGTTSWLLVHEFDLIIMYTGKSTRLATKCAHDLIVSSPSS
jgi:hypothetical protein